MKIGDVYKVTSNWQVSFGGVPLWRDGFYKLIGFSQSDYPVFQDKDSFFEAGKDFTIEPLKNQIDESQLKRELDSGVKNESF